MEVVEPLSIWDTSVSGRLRLEGGWRKGRTFWRSDALRLLRSSAFRTNLERVASSESVRFHRRRARGDAVAAVAVVEACRVRLVAMLFALLRHFELALDAMIAIEFR